jgi:hypothetical protein
MRGHCESARSVAKLIVPDWGDKVDSGIWLSYRPARLYRLAGRYENPLRRSQLLYIHHSRTMNLTTVHTVNYGATLT